MSWFSVSLNDIKGQLTSFTNDVLSEGLEDVEGDVQLYYIVNLRLFQGHFYLLSVLF